MISFEAHVDLYLAILMTPFSGIHHLMRIFCDTFSFLLRVCFFWGVGSFHTHFYAGKPFKAFGIKFVNMAWKL